MVQLPQTNSPPPAIVADEESLSKRQPPFGQAIVRKIATTREIAAAVADVDLAPVVADVAATGAAESSSVHLVENRDVMTAVPLAARLWKNHVVMHAADAAEANDIVAYLVDAATRLADADATWVVSAIQPTVAVVPTLVAADQAVVAVVAKRVASFAGCSQAVARKDVVVCSVAVKETSVDVTVPTSMKPFLTGCKAAFLAVRIKPDKSRPPFRCLPHNLLWIRHLPPMPGRQSRLWMHPSTNADN